MEHSAYLNVQIVGIKLDQEWCCMGENGKMKKTREKTEWIWTWNVFGNDIMTVTMPSHSKITWYRRLLTRIFFGSIWTKMNPNTDEHITNWREVINN